MRKIKNSIDKLSVLGLEWSQSQQQMTILYTKREMGKREEGVGGFSLT